MEKLPALNLKNLDKSQWKTYRFDEIAKNISERVDPNNTDLEVYVGLEHIDSESIHLKRSGTPDDVDGQKLRFYPGDVIFGRRRAYQRKAAVATTHGFCSAHALVLRANPEVIDPQLFPFFMHSDTFMHRAVDISVGSLSPTINWGTIKNQEFKVPPVEIQSRVIDLMLVLDEYLIQSEEVYAEARRLKNIFVKNLVSDAKAFIELGSLFDVSWGDTNITKKSYISSGFDAYSATGLDGMLPTFAHATEGIVLSAIGADCGKCFYATGKWTAIKNTITIIPRFNNINFLKLVYEIINDRDFWPTSGGAQPFISQSDARKVLIPKMSDEEVLNSNLEIDHLNRSMVSIENKNNHIKKLSKNITNELF